MYRVPRLPLPLLLLTVLLRRQDEAQAIKIRRA